MPTLSLPTTSSSISYLASTSKSVSSYTVHRRFSHIAGTRLSGSTSRPHAASSPTDVSSARAR